MDLKELKKQLTKAYPTKQVKKMKKELYSSVYRFSLKNKQSISEFLQSIGFNYIKNDAENITKTLRKLYPNNVVISLTSHKVYGAVLYKAQKSNLTVEQYLKGLGFDYYDGRKNGEKVEVDIEQETQKQKEYLSKKFKDKIVKNIFNSKNQKIYYWIRKIAKLKNKTVELHLADMGFKYVGGKIDEKDIAKKLEENFPNKIIANASKTHPKLDSYLKRKAKLSNVSVEDYCKNIGFTYIKSERQTIETAEEHLLELYPNRIIDKSLVVLNRNLYSLISLHAKKQSKTVTQYIEGLGFTFSKKRERIRNMDLEQELLKYYPNRKVQKIKDMDVQLYQRILRKAKMENKRVSLYLKKLGFTYSALRKKKKKSIS